MLINAELAYKYEGLPKGRWRCRYLTECRRPKEEGWKCYNGCKVIKEREEREKKLIEKQEKKELKEEKTQILDGYNIETIVVSVKFGFSKMSLRTC